MESSFSSPGFFGKLPSNGDFVTRRLPKSPFLNTWDNWLQVAIAKSREHLQENWLTTYLTSPIWRFALSPGLCGDFTWAGLLMPSVDKVGRYFPLTIAMRLSNKTHPFQVVDEASEWFTNAENIALTSLDDDINLEDFDRDVHQLGIPELGNHALNTNLTINQATPLHLNIPSANSISQAYSGLLNLLIGTNYSNYSLWWTDGSDHVEPCLIVSPGLPPEECFTALLDGDWNKWGWPLQLGNKPLVNSGSAP